jgi:hypothetical protein
LQIAAAVGTVATSPMPTLPPKASNERASRFPFRPIRARFGGRSFRARSLRQFDDFIVVSIGEYPADEVI